MVKKKPIVDEKGRLNYYMIVYGNNPKRDHLIGKSKKHTATGVLAVLTNNLNRGKQIVIFPPGTVLK